jgi:hypothetical protein
MDGTSVFTVVLVVVLVVGAIYLMDPTLFGLLGPKMVAVTASASGRNGNGNGNGMYEQFEDSGSNGPKVTGRAMGNIGGTAGGELTAAAGMMNGLGVTGGAQADMSMGGGATGGVTAEGFQNNASAGAGQVDATMGNANVADVGAYEGPAQFGNAEAPAGCYPRDQLTPSELLPKDPNSVWSQQNPMGVGSLKGKNFLSAGALIGVNTVGQSMRNANLQLRSEPPNPQMPVSIFNVPTIEPDINRRPLEIG